MGLIFPVLRFTFYLDPYLLQTNHYILGGLCFGVIFFHKDLLSLSSIQNIYDVYAPAVLQNPCLKNRGK